MFRGDVTPLGNQQDIDPPGRARDVTSYPILDPARIATSLGSRDFSRKMRASPGNNFRNATNDDASGIRKTTIFLLALTTLEAPLE